MAAERKLSFDEHAREAVLALRESGLKLGEGEGHLLAMLAEIGQEPGQVKGLSSALDAAEKGLAQAVDIVALTMGMRQLAVLMGDELAEHQAEPGPGDVRDQPPQW